VIPVQQRFVHGSNSRLAAKVLSFCHPRFFCGYNRRQSMFLQGFVYGFATIFLACNCRAMQKNVNQG